MAKRSTRKKTGASVKVMQALGVIIALSMILVLFVPRAGITSDDTSASSATEVFDATATPIPEPTVTLMPSPTPGSAIAPTASD
ncbi:MAG: hypothetical protein JXA42_24870 [Anaerolineales bacterium]|nr:hypothetical protein [Anaerolineales bacterium]